MPIQDTSNIKEKILFILKTRGPSLPVHITKETRLSILFASAFLSELLSEKTIKISSMKVGNSPVYFLPGQETMLENFSQYLSSKEKEAFIILKEKRFLKDKEQVPAIRVALRAIKDFAIPFKKNEEIFWRYFKIPETEFKIKEKPVQSIPPSPEIEKKEQKPQSKEPPKPDQIPQKQQEQKTTQEISIEKKPQELNIFDKPSNTKKIIAKTIKNKTSKVDERFFNKVKEFLSNREIRIVGIEGFSKKDLTLKIKEKEKEKLLMAFNKKRVNEQDIIKAYKKAEELKLEYIILSLGEPVKKITNFIEAIRNLEAIGKI